MVWSTTTWDSRPGTHRVLGVPCLWKRVRWGFLTNSQELSAQIDTDLRIGWLGAAIRVAEACGLERFLAGCMHVAAIWEQGLGPRGSLKGPHTGQFSVGREDGEVPADRQPPCLQPSGSLKVWVASG